MNKTNQAVIYTRVSSDGQRETGYSLDAQLDFLKDYAKRQNLEVIKVFSESMSAKEAGRIEFNKMLDFAKKNKCHVLFEKNDRHLRNEADEATIIDLSVRKGLIIFHFVKDNLILRKESTPYEIFIYHLLCGMSSLYPRNLSNEVKKGLYKKAEQGYLPGVAPFGYKNKRINKKAVIVIDTDTELSIKKIFELYSTGLYSYFEVAKKINEMNLYHKKFQEKLIERIITNPIYYGDFDFKGKRYKGVHQPIINKNLWVVCQNVRQNRTQTKITDYDYIFKGFIRCTQCGRIISPEKHSGAHHSGTYIYYGCTNRKVKHENYKMLKETTANEIILDFLKKIQPKAEQIEIIKNHFKTTVNKNFEDENRKQENILKRMNVLKNRLNVIYEDKLDGVIDNEMYYKKREEYQTELEKLEIAAGKFNKEMNNYVDTACNILELCKTLPTLYLQGDIDFKRKILKLTTSNLFYNGQTLTVQAIPPIKPLLKLAEGHKMGLMSDIQNLYVIADELLNEIKNSENIIYIENLSLLKTA